jgi:hypothetical protein
LVAISPANHTYNVLSEKDYKDESEHGNETGLDDPSVSVPLLEPSGSEDGQDRAHA